jgi:O-antigen ligase
VRAGAAIFESGPRLIQVVLIGVGVLWPLIAFAGGLGFSVLVTLAGLLCLPFAASYLRPQIYMIGILTLLAYAATSAVWSHREIELFQIDFAGREFAVRFEVIRIALILIWTGLLITAASRLEPHEARNVERVATWAIVVQLVAVAGLIFFEKQALNFFSFAMSEPGEGLQNIARNGVILALAAPFLIVGFGRQLSFSRALVVEISVFAVVVVVLAMGDVIGPIMSVGVGLAAVAVVRTFPTIGFKLLGIGIAIYILAAPILYGLLASGANTANVSSSIDWRLAIWKRAGEMIQQEPITGHGLGAFRTVGDLAPAGDATARHLANHPHNMALQVWVEAGAFGAAIFAILILMVAFRMPEPRRLGVAGFLAAALAGQFLAIGLSFDLWNDWLWACAGILAAMFVVVARAESATEANLAQEPTDAWSARGYYPA